MKDIILETNQIWGLSTLRNTQIDRYFTQMYLINAQGVEGCDQ